MNSPDREPSLADASEPINLEPEVNRATIETGPGWLDVAGGAFDSSPRPELCELVDRVATKQARLAIVQSDHHQELQGIRQEELARDDSFEALITAAHNDLVRAEQDTKRDSSRFYRRLKQSGFNLELGTRREIERLVRGLGQEPPNVLLSLIRDLGGLMNFLAITPSRIHPWLQKCHLGYGVTVEAVRRLGSAASKIFQGDVRAAGRELGRGGRTLALWPKVLASKGTPVQAYQEFCTVRLKALPGISLRDELGSDLVELVFIERRSLTQLERARASTLYSRERFVRSLLHMAFGGKPEPMQRFVEYLGVAACGESREVLRQVLTEDQSAEVAALEAEMAVDRKALEAGAELSVAELDYLHRAHVLEINRSFLQAVASAPNRREQEVGWYQSWVRQLAEEVTAALTASGVDAAVIAALLEAAVSESWATVKQRLLSLAPTAHADSRLSLQWYGQYQRLLCEHSSQDPEERDLQEASHALVADPDARLAFERHIVDVLCTRYGLQESMRSQMTTRSLQELPAVTQRQSRKHRGQVAPSDSLMIPQTEASAEQMTVGGVLGIAYSDRLDPRSRLEVESHRFSTLLRQGKVLLSPLNPAELYRPDAWVEATASHIATSLQALPYQETGESTRIARKVFHHVAGLRDREFLSYGDRAYCFHPPGGNSRFYIVVRVLDSAEGQLVVWKVALTQREQRRSRKRRSP